MKAGHALRLGNIAKPKNQWGEGLIESNSNLVGSAKRDRPINREAYDNQQSV
jgi:hypothetical protein